MLKSKLSGANFKNAINIWTVAMVRYEAGIISWNKGEQDKIDRQTRKLLNMQRGLHPRPSFDTLCIPRAQGGRGLLIVKLIMLQTTTRDF